MCHRTAAGHGAKDIRGGVALDICASFFLCHSTLRRDKVTPFEAPEVIVVAKDTTSKHDPTKKVVVFGSVNGQRNPGYDLRWTQVRAKK